MAGPPTAPGTDLRRSRHVRHDHGTGVRVDFRRYSPARLEVVQRVCRSADVYVRFLPAGPQGEAPEDAAAGHRVRPGRHYAGGAGRQGRRAGTARRTAPLPVRSFRNLRTHKSRPIRWRSFSGQCRECPRNRWHAEGWRGKVHSISSAGGTRHSGTGGGVMACYNLMVQPSNRRADGRPPTSNPAPYSDTPKQRGRAAR